MAAVMAAVAKVAGRAVAAKAVVLVAERAEEATVEVVSVRKAA